MNCPFCNKEMNEETIGEGKVLVCRNDLCNYFVRNNKEKRCAYKNGELISFTVVKTAYGMF